MEEINNRDYYHEGMTCITSDQQEIGTVVEIGQNHFRLSTSFLGLGAEYYVPFSSVERLYDNNIFLNVDKDSLPQMRWELQPVGWLVVS